MSTLRQAQHENKSTSTTLQGYLMTLAPYFDAFMMTVSLCIIFLDYLLDAGIIWDGFYCKFLNLTSSFNSKCRAHYAKVSLLQVSLVTGK